MEPLTLNQKLRLIGFNLNEELPKNSKYYLIDIEKILAELLTSIEYMSDPYRIFTIALTWIEIHGWSLNSSKFVKILSGPEFKAANVSYIALASAFAVGLKLRNWQPLLKKFEPAAEREFAALSDEAARAYRGLEKWAEEYQFQIAKGSLKTNPKWVHSRSALAELNLQYKNRLIYGADWRGDVVTAIQMGADRPTTIVKWIGISYEPAYRIFQDLSDAGVVEQYRTKKAIL